MSENDAFDAALDEQRKEAGANSRTALLANIKTVLLIESIAANIFLDLRVSRKPRGRSKIRHAGISMPRSAPF